MYKLHRQTKSAKNARFERCRNWPECVFLKHFFFLRKNSDMGLYSHHFSVLITAAHLKKLISGQVGEVSLQFGVPCCS